MICYQLEKNFEKRSYHLEDMNTKERICILFERAVWDSGMDAIGFEYDWDLGYSSINGCKAECQPDYFLVVLCIPAVLQPEGNKQEIFCFLNAQFLILVDQDHAAAQILNVIEQKQKEKQKSLGGLEVCLYHFFSQLLLQGNSVMELYEQQMITLEERIMLRPMENFHEELMILRKNLLELECYYDQMADVLREMRENENGYFAKEHLRYFGIVSERAQRMERRAAKLLEQSKQIRDVYQAQIEAKQNQIVQFLTVVSTIFAPLTLLTGWYGMNFHQMPELEWGYPGVIFIAAALITVLIIYFKKHHFF